uniref:Glutamate-1-semialdehyde 2,1-aminomutase n=1 Tax=Glossina palpalis gambiensis TaxID=67801 RepID=A0A1B0C4V8_9MUSC
MPGGVNSPIRSFNLVHMQPAIIKKANGPYLFDINNNRHIDYICTWGAIILGHNNIRIKSQIKKYINEGLHFGLLTEIEIKIAQLISKCVPSIEMIRMPISHGIPHHLLSETLSCPYNDCDSIETVFKLFSNEIACVIVEPIAGNMGCIPSQTKFLRKLRTLCDKFNSLLIMDEVITGFRISLGGAQSYYKIYPDLTCLGKIIGGGLPIGAFGGKKKIMQHLSPTGGVYQAGTFSGNPVSMIAGYTCLKILKSLDK